MQLILNLFLAGFAVESLHSFRMPDRTTGSKYLMTWFKRPLGTRWNSTYLPSFNIAQADACASTGPRWNSTSHPECSGTLALVPGTTLQGFT